MFNLIRANQLNIMLLLCGACFILIFLLVHTRFLTRSRKIILMLEELTAFFLLWFDRQAYIYAGDPSSTGYIMVRVSNFLVFFLTSAQVFVFNLYLSDLMKDEGKMTSIPKRLVAVRYLSTLGMALAVIAAFTDLYYYFDETNKYHRGQWFLLAYIIPVICPIIQYTVIFHFRKLFSRLLNLAMAVYIFVPVICGILQIFTYGISIVNMAMVLVCISLYFFTYLDMNDTVEHVHELEIRNMQSEHDRMRKLFDQTANAFVSAVETKDDYSKGKAAKTAEYARRIAMADGKTPDECEKIYYAALLHDVGLIGIPDAVIRKEQDPNERDVLAMQKKPLIGSEILSSITEYPFLGETARYSHERYNGSGYPEGLKGEEIPETARIVGVADAYVTMTSRKRYREAKPDFLAREAFVKGSGESFDPKFADIMIKILDSDSSAEMMRESAVVETDIKCREYRSFVSNGIPVTEKVSRITFDFIPVENDKDFDFSAPSLILFDSFDQRVHDNERAVEAYNYQEYGEIWFDEHNIQTAARKLESRIENRAGAESEAVSGADSPAFTAGRYEIIASRFEDHMSLKLLSPAFEKEVTVALPNGSQFSYISLTGENCELKNIKVESTGETVGPDDIPRIADKISYIDRMESDIGNIQIDMYRAASTDGIEIKDRLTLIFHTMSLPGSHLIWHCPYFVIFSSDDGKVGGNNYREYGLVKLNGENDGDTGFSKNSILMKKTDEFPGWDTWKELHKAGLECEVFIKRKGNRIALKTKNLGVETENITTIADLPGKVYVAITGEQVAITDIRVKY